jgi:hypothetical protein
MSLLYIDIGMNSLAANTQEAIPDKIASKTIKRANKRLSFSDPFIREFQSPFHRA